MDERKKLPQILKILDDTTVVVNLGMRDGITTKDTLNILDKHKITLTDPCTNEILGNIRQMKEKIFVTEVHEKFCICVSKYTKIKNHNPAIEALMKPFEPLTGGKNKQTKQIIGNSMNINDDEVSGLYTHNTVHIGDEVCVVEK